MIRLLDKTRIPFFDYFYLLSVIIYAGMASAFVRDFGDIRTIGNAVILILTILFAIHKRVTIKRDFVFVIAVFIIWSVFTIVYNGSTKYLLWEWMRWSIFLYVAYVICKGYGYRFFVIAETVLFHLAVIGIFCWIILLIIPVPFTNFLSLFSLPSFNDVDQFTSENVLFYTIIKSNVFGGGARSEYYFLIRNCGFAWEPGAFACFMCFAVALNSLRTNVRLKNNLPLIVFLIALASTQSTTGYVTLGVMIAVWLIIYGRIGWVIALVPLILMMFNLPFISDKLVDSMEGFQDISLDNAAGSQGYDRTLSFMLLLDEFTRHPIFGYGFSEARFMQYEITTFSGLGHLLAQFGIIVFLLFGFLLIKASLLLNRHFGNKTGWMIMVAVIGMMISYMVWTQPFFIAIWLSSVFMKQSSERKLLVNYKRIE